MKRRGFLGAAAFGAAAAALVLSCAAKGDVVLIRGEDYAFVDNGAGAVSGLPSRVTTTFGTVPNRGLGAGVNYAALGYETSATGFKVNFGGTRSGALGSYDAGGFNIDFRAADATTTYALDGEFRFSNPFGSLYAQLLDRTTGKYVYDYHYTNNGPGAAFTTFTVGGTQGQINETTPGALSGTLDPTHQYLWSTYFWIEARPEADNGASGSGWLSLSFGQAAPGSTPLPTAAAAGLALLAGTGVGRRRRPR